MQKSFLRQLLREGHITLDVSREMKFQKRAVQMEFGTEDKRVSSFDRTGIQVPEEMAHNGAGWIKVIKGGGGKK